MIVPALPALLATPRAHLTRHAHPLLRPMLRNESLELAVLVLGPRSAQRLRLGDDAPALHTLAFRELARRERVAGDSSPGDFALGSRSDEGLEIRVVLVRPGDRFRFHGDERGRRRVWTWVELVARAERGWGTEEERSFEVRDVCSTGEGVACGEGERVPGGKRVVASLCDQSRCSSWWRGAGAGKGKSTRTLSQIQICRMRAPPLFSDSSFFNVPLPKRCACVLLRHYLEKPCSQEPKLLFRKSSLSPPFPEGDYPAFPLGSGR